MDSNSNDTYSSIITYDVFKREKKKMRLFMTSIREIYITET